MWTICLHGYGRSKTSSIHKGKKQLEKVDVDWSRELSVVRIDIKRVIGILKQNYTILQATIPITLIKDSIDDGN